MIVINAPLCQDKIMDYVTNLEVAGASFTFKEKKGIQLFFDVVGDNVELDKVARAVKLGIKEQEWGSVLFFQCTAA